MPGWVAAGPGLQLLLPTLGEAASVGYLSAVVLAVAITKICQLQMNHDHAYRFLVMAACICSSGTSQESKSPPSPHARVTAAKAALDAENQRLHADLLTAFEPVLKRAPSGSDSASVTKRTELSNDKDLCASLPDRAPTSLELKSASAKREKEARAARDAYRAIVKSAAAALRAEGDVKEADAMLLKLRTECPDYPDPARAKAKLELIGKNCREAKRGHAPKVATDTKEKMAELCKRCDDGTISAIDLGKEIVSLRLTVENAGAYKDPKQNPEWHGRLAEVFALLNGMVIDMEK